MGTLAPDLSPPVWRGRRAVAPESSGATMMRQFRRAVGGTLARPQSTCRGPRQLGGGCDHGVRTASTHAFIAHPPLPSPSREAFPRGGGVEQDLFPLPPWNHALPRRLREKAGSPRAGRSTHVGGEGEGCCGQEEQWRARYATKSRAPLGRQACTMGYRNGRARVAGCWRTRSGQHGWPAAGAIRP